MSNEYTNPALNNQTEQKSSFTDKFLFKVYLYLVFAFAFAGITGIILSFIFDSMFNANDPNALLYWLLAFVGSFILIFVFTLIINIQSIRNKNSIILLGLYSIARGVFISCFTYLLNPLLVGGAFLITAVIFLGASVIGYFMSGKAHRVAVMVAGGLLIAALLCCLLNFVLIPIYLFNGYTDELYWASLWIYFVVEAAILLCLVISVASTTYKLRHLDDAHMPSNVKNSLAISVALSLFTSFINIFIRVLYFLAILLSHKK